MKYTTKVWKGQNIFQVWDDSATPGAKGHKTAISFGLKKAKAIIASVPQIQAFVIQEMAKDLLKAKE